MKPTLCVVLHDVAPATLPACERVLAAVEEVGDVPMTLLAVPRYHCEPTSSTFVRWLADRSAGGDEIALHGYTHQDDGVPNGFVDYLRRRHYTRGEGEFCDLAITEAMRRLIAGVRWFSRQGLSLRGFVAPAWLMSPGTWQALRWLDLSYTCTLRQLVLLPDRRSLVSQSLVYSSSSAWRRQASLAWNAALATAQRHNPLLRLELHPHDADHAAIRHSWQRLLETQLAQRRAGTLADAAERFRMQTDWDRLGRDTNFEELGNEQQLDDEQHEHRGQRAYGRADRHVARIVQAQHHA
ncbi:polysaccharide deacetylase family protein [Piscinibacter sp.]|uniref:polysaccharide deacetylase family protein n=1 Tax=Piscinibacter sp. TaxID=1903157 RepID=UPI002CB2A9F4|nr:polysaccharide deacetylase family protein [Albitalea sp.]HUG24759.1 polysaccharide deacetylase family protein [Albitalea sp.]